MATRMTVSLSRIALVATFGMLAACGKSSSTTIPGPAPTAKPAAQPAAQPAAAPVSSSAKAGKTPAKPAPALSADMIAQVRTLESQMKAHYNDGANARKTGDNSGAREHQAKAKDCLEKIDALIADQLLWQEEAEMEGWAQPAEYVEMAKVYGSVSTLAKMVRMGGGK
jgi:hypothetical protein